MGGEVVLLAEDFGSAEVVPRTEFAKTLKSGYSSILRDRFWRVVKVIYLAAIRKAWSCFLGNPA